MTLPLDALDLPGALGGGHEGDDQVVVLEAGRALDAAGDVDAPRVGGDDGLADVVGVEPAGDDRGNTALPGPQQVPVEGLAGTAMPATGEGVEEVVVDAE